MPISPISLTVFRNFWILAVSPFFRPSISAAGSITHERYIPFACDLRHSTIESNLSRDLRSPPRSIPRDPVTRREPCTPRFFNTQTREKKRERERRDYVVVECIATHACVFRARMISKVNDVPRFAEDLRQEKVRGEPIDRS